jgi:predicted enzyme related to lactoylglutathione lyase
MEGDEEVETVFVPLGEAKDLDEQSIADGVTNATLPSVTCAVLTHRSSYRTIANTYRQLGAWVATNATAVELPVRELYVISVDEAVTFDCTDATVVSQFWSAVLGRPIDTEPMPPSEFFASIGLGDSSRIAYMFIQVPEGKAVKNRVHLDLDADDVTAEVARVTALGATHIHDKDEYGMQWTTLADPEGNEFCIGTPHL